MSIRSIAGSLSLRLSALLFATIIAAFGVYAFVNIRSTSRNWEHSVYEWALHFSELIQHSTHYSMLLNRKQDVHHIIRTIAEGPGVENVRIYDKQGMIIFSALSEEIGGRVDLQAEACVSCHARSEPLQSVPVDNRVRLFSRPGGERILGLINPIENAPDCSSADCHAHPPDQSILGVLDVTMSMAEPDRRLAAVKQQALIAALLMAVTTGLFSAGFIVRVVRRPVNDLITGVERVAGGRLDTEIAIQSSDEIGQLAAAFNSMTRDLRRAREELTAWSDRLESELRDRTDELNRTQRQALHVEKMASLGKLAATVAHELNNPLAGIMNYAKLVKRTLDESSPSIADRQELDRYLAAIQRETARSGTIVRNLLTFSRPSGIELGAQSLNALIEHSLMLVGHHLEMSDITLESHPLEGDDRLVCDAGHVEQALVALLVNAIEAMPEGGTLRISAEGDPQSVRITIADTGVGISRQSLPRIFEPFYTTKNHGEGAGLGLAVVYGIVRRHGGEIEVESAVGKGATFRVRLPRRPPGTGASGQDRTMSSGPLPQVIESGGA